MSGTKTSPAKYHQRMTDEEQRELEIRCVKDENFIREDGSVRSYYMDTGKMIGASQGAETAFVYVEHAKTGDVHGRPVTREQLIQMGVHL